MTTGPTQPIHDPEKRSSTMISRTRLAALAGGLALTVVLTACGGTDGTQPTTPAAPSAAATATAPTTPANTGCPGSDAPAGTDCDTIPVGCPGATTPGTPTGPCPFESTAPDDATDTDDDNAEPTSTAPDCDSLATILVGASSLNAEGGDTITATCVEPDRHYVLAVQMHELQLVIATEVPVTATDETITMETVKFARSADTGKPLDLLLIECRNRADAAKLTSAKPNYNRIRISYIIETGVVDMGGTIDKENRIRPHSDRPCDVVVQTTTYAQAA